MRNGLAYRRVLWAPAINEIGGGALPTPVAQTGQGGPKGLDGGSGARQMLADAGFPRAAGAPSSLPTPRTCSAMAAPVNTTGNLQGDRFPNLETVLGRMLPAEGTKDPTSSLRYSNVAGRTLPTPSTSDHVDRTYHYPPCTGLTRGEKLVWALGSELGHNNGKDGQPGVNRSIPTGDPMYLNPSFVEEMMGFPVGWTV